MAISPLNLQIEALRSNPTGFCLFDYLGETMAGNVVIGPPSCEPLVGSHVLQDFRLVIDLGTHEVTRAQAMRAKRFAQSAGLTYAHPKRAGDIQKI